MQNEAKAEEQRILSEKLGWVRDLNRSAAFGRFLDVVREWHGEETQAALDVDADDTAPARRARMRLGQVLDFIDEEEKRLLRQIND